MDLWGEVNAEIDRTGVLHPGAKPPPQVHMLHKRLVEVHDAAEPCGYAPTVCTRGGMSVALRGIRPADAGGRVATPSPRSRPSPEAEAWSGDGRCAVVNLCVAGVVFVPSKQATPTPGRHAVAGILTEGRAARGAGRPPKETASDLIVPFEDTGGKLDALPVMSKPEGPSYSYKYLFDGGCSVCTSVVAMLKSRRGHENIYFEDISLSSFKPAKVLTSLMTVPSPGLSSERRGALHRSWGALAMCMADAREVEPLACRVGAASP